MRRGVIIKTVINSMTFDGSTTDAMQQAVRDALIAFMAATAQARAEASKSAQRAGIDHKRQAQPSAYLGRKPSYDRATFDRIKLALDSTSPPSLSAIGNITAADCDSVIEFSADFAQPNCVRLCDSRLVTFARIDALKAIRNADEWLSAVAAIRA